MGSSLQVTGIDHVVFHVKDLARSKKFYIDFLGMNIDHESSWQCFLKCGNQGVALFEVEDDEKIHGGSEVNHMALRLVSGELARVKALLENAGIEVHGRERDPTCIYFSDPDGHRLQLLMPNE
jgi:catechol 2,3-dioxygenase-like lactoylglutathione lyase family enzyme